MHRPQIHPGLVRVWHDPQTVQLGLAPPRGAVLTGLVDGDDVLLAALDGRHDLADLRRVALARGLPGERADDLVGLLDGAGLLREAGPGRRVALDRAHLSRLPDDVRERLAPDAAAWSLAYPGGPDGHALLAHRAGHRVLVDGSGRLADALVATLVESGVGDVQAGPTPSGDPHDLVVLVRDDVVDARLADELVRDDRPHLAVVAQVDRVVVGPLVLPGRGPCLRCLDLHRADRDPSWPRVRGQLLASEPVARAETSVAALAAGLAAAQVLVHLDGTVRPVTHGRTLDVVLPDGLVERRRWSAHASCGCARWPPPDDDPSAGTPSTGATAGAPLRGGSAYPMMDR